MALPPPRKRQRRQQVVLSSEDEQNNEDMAVPDDENRFNALDAGSASGKEDRGIQKNSNGHTAASSSASFSSSFLPSESRTTRAQTQTKLPASLSPKSSRSKSHTGQSTTITPASSPEKRRTRKTKKKQETDGNHHATATTTTTSPNKDAEKSKSMRAFFQPATEEQRWERAGWTLPKGKTSGIEEQQLRGWEEEEDLIEDDGVDEIFEGLMKNGHGDKDGVGSGREGTWDAKISNGRAEGRDKRRAKKKFVLPTVHDSGPDFMSGNENNWSASSPSLAGSPGSSARPWAEEFAPMNLDELAVHKKKVADVQNWLVNVFSGKNRSRILVLRGPAGSGKTTTVSLLSKVLGYDVVEWKNSTAAEYGTPGYISRGAQFDDFLGRSDKFSTLEMDDEQSHPGPQVESAYSGSQRRIILVEEFPTSLSSGSSGLNAFRTALQRYLATTVPLAIDKRLERIDPSSSPPIIVVVSETLLGTGSSLADNFTVHRLLGPEISNHPGVSIIEFNRVAPTFISKALDLVLKKEARRSKRRRVPGPAVLKRISEMGDVRSAVSSLEFLCLRGDDSGGSEGWSGTLATRMKRPGKTGTRPTAMENESLEMVTQREASLGIFHAVGKVMYNKREDASITSPQGAPEPNDSPPHLQVHSRPKPSQVSVEELINETGTDIQTFVAALHENYVLSCSGSTYSDCLEGCISHLSDADILAGESRRGYRASRSGVSSARSSFQGYGTTIDVLRQEEMSFHAAVRGLLFSLPYPVKRRAVPGTRAGDAHKMFFPTSLRLWRDNEEMDGLLDVWIRRLTTSAPPGSIAPASRTGGVESWKSRVPFSVPSSDDAGEQTQSAAEVRALVSRDEVLLERLPYMSRLAKDPSDLKQLEKLTKFRGIVEQSDDPVDEDLDNLDGSAAAEPWATDNPPISPKKRRLPDPKASGDGLSTEPVEDVVDKLVLSDDDIED